MALHVEFTVEPFVAGRPGPHVTAALQVLDDAGIEAEFGPFGSAFTIADTDLAVLSDAVAAAFAAGATRVSTQLSARPDGA